MPNINKTGKAKKKRGKLLQARGRFTNISGFRMSASNDLLFRERSAGSVPFFATNTNSNGHFCLEGGNGNLAGE